MGAKGIAARLRQNMVATFNIGKVVNKTYFGASIAKWRLKAE